jgi:hypothetical protein
LRVIAAFLPGGGGRHCWRRSVRSSLRPHKRKPSARTSEDSASLRYADRPSAGLPFSSAFLAISMACGAISFRPAGGLGQSARSLANVGLCYALEPTRRNRIDQQYSTSTQYHGFCFYESNC